MIKIDECVYVIHYLNKIAALPVSVVKKLIIFNVNDGSIFQYFLRQEICSMVEVDNFVLLIIIFLTAIDK